MKFLDTSSILFLNKEERWKPTVDTAFINAKEGFVYLGIKITPEIKTVVSVNYDPLVDELMDDDARVDDWTNQYNQNE